MELQYPPVLVKRERPEDDSLPFFYLEFLDSHGKIQKHHVAFETGREYNAIKYVLEQTRDPDAQLPWAVAARLVKIMYHECVECQ